SLCLFSNCSWQWLWVASASQAGDASAVTVVNKLGCIFCRHDQVLVIANPVRQINYLLVEAPCCGPQRIPLCVVKFQHWHCFKLHSPQYLIIPFYSHSLQYLQQLPTTR